MSAVKAGIPTTFWTTPYRRMRNTSRDIRQIILDMSFNKGVSGYCRYQSVAAPVRFGQPRHVYFILCTECVIGMETQDPCANLSTVNDKSIQPAWLRRVHGEPETTG